MVQPPILVGLRVCHEAIVEESTKRVTLVNCFQRLAVPSFPSPKMPFKICGLLTDGKGETELFLSLKRSSTLDEHYVRSFRVNFSDPLRQVWFIFTVSRFRFPEMGRYQVELKAGNELLGLCVFDVDEKGDKNESSS
jgi:hypothetical protein